MLRAVRDNRTLSEHAKIAYLMVWSRLPAVHPSVPRLAEDMGASESTARRAVAELVKANLVKIVPRLTDCGDSDTNGYGLAPLTGGGVVSHRHPKNYQGKNFQREGLSLPRSPSCGPSCRTRPRETSKEF